MVRRKYAFQIGSPVLMRDRNLQLTVVVSVPFHFCLISQIEYFQNVKLKAGISYRRRTSETIMEMNYTGSPTTDNQEYQIHRSSSQEATRIQGKAPKNHAEELQQQETFIMSLNAIGHRRLITQCNNGFDAVFDGTSFCFDGNETNGGPGDETIDGDSESNSTSAPTDESYVIEPDQPMRLDQQQEAVTDSYGFLGYLCNDNLEQIEASETDVAAQVGPTVRICVERNAKAIQDGLYIRQIAAFTFFRDNIRQAAITLVGEAAQNGLTELHCQQGAHKCWFETYLMAEFFSKESYVQGSGAATLQFGDKDNRRKLGRDEPTKQRTLQDKEDLSKSRPFAIEFLATNEDLLNRFQVRGDTDQKDKNWLVFGLTSILLLLGIVAYSERNYVLSRWTKRSAEEASPLPEISKDLQEEATFVVEPSDQTTNSASAINGSAVHHSLVGVCSTLPVTMNPVPYPMECNDGDETHNSHDNKMGVAQNHSVAPVSTARYIQPKTIHDLSGTTASSVETKATISQLC